MHDRSEIRAVNVSVPRSNSALFCRLELESRLLALFAKMGFAASSTASEQTSAADLASLVSAIATTRPLSQAGSPEVQGLQGALLADTVLSRCRSEDTQLVKVWPSLHSVGLPRVHRTHYEIWEYC